MNAFFPNVPFFPGVPAVARNGSNPGVLPPATPLVSDSLNGSGAARAIWGIYDQYGTLALEPDSIKAMEPSREARVLDYPVERGGFQSYNKVMTPGEVRVTVTKGGSDSDRRAFLDALDRLVASLDLFTVLTPDSAFPDRSITRYDYRRTSESGATLLTVELSTVEVRQKVKSAFSSTKEPAGADTTDNGPVQAKDATPAQQAPVTTAAGTATASKVVPTTAAPSQRLSTVLDGQATRVKLTQKSTGLFADVYRNDKLIIAGVRALNDVALVRSPYLGFVGDLMLHNTAGAADPTYDALNTQFLLLYAGRP